jgi:hypothetical protein
VRIKNHETPPYKIFFSLPYFLPLRPKYLPLNPILEHPQPMFVPYVRDQDLHLHTTTGNVIVQHILMVVNG